LVSPSLRRGATGFDERFIEIAGKLSYKSV
jgi:hypothetical protein